MPSGDLMTWGFWNVKKLMLMADSPMDMMPSPLADPQGRPELLSMLNKASVEEVAALLGPYWTTGRSTKNGMQFKFGLLIEQE
jgi:hypothetical protein